MDNIQILAGNDLRSGRVVYLQANGDWSADYCRARGLFTETDRDLAEKIGQTAVNLNQVIDPYLVETTTEVESVPVHIRERIRRSGPTCLPTLLQSGAN